MVKQTFDTEAKITLNDRGGIEDKDVNLIIDPYTEFAVEEALRIKERLGGKVTVLCAGPESATTAIRHAFAMGADDAYLISDPALESCDQIGTAAVLAKALEKIPYDLILGGYKTVDKAGTQVCQRVAVQLGIPVVSVVTKIEVDEGNKKAIVHREIDDGHEDIEVGLPAIFTAQQGVAEPRYPNMRGIMQAKKKPITTWSIADLGLGAGDIGSAKVKVVGYELPAGRQGGRKIEGEPEEAAAKVVQLLRNEAKVI